MVTGDELPDPAHYQVLVAGRPTEEQLRASSALHTLIIPFAGVPRITIEVMRGFPAVRIHNLHHNAAPTAELAVSLMLAAGKQVIPLDRALRRGDWSPRYDMSTAMLFAGKTALVVGYGAIGRRIAAACRGLGMSVIGVRRRPMPPGGPDEATSANELAHANELSDLLPRANVLFLCLPTTDHSRGLIGAAELARLPRGALLVNVARGPIVDERALYDALRTGQLAAAGLDVWYRYPESQEMRRETRPSELPLWELDNVVLSPHRGGHCSETERLRAEHLALLLNAAARGEELPNHVDLDQGY
jgi:phosphoglycerate dehydrogenase-like enzyme